MLIQLNKDMGLLPPLPPPLEYPASLLEWEEEMWARRDRRFGTETKYNVVTCFYLETNNLFSVTFFNLKFEESSKFVLTGG